MFRRCLSLPLILALLSLLGGAAWLLGGERPAGAQTLGEIAVSVREGGVGQGLFGSIELRSDLSRALPQWGRILVWLEESGPGFADCIDEAAACHSGVQREWGEMMAEARDLPPREQLDRVNRFFNRWPYRYDNEVYGVSDYWADPWEFMENSGDCEDYAIAKFYTLELLAFPEESLRIVTVMDEIRAVGHAVLSVEIGGETLVLDSLSDGIFRHSDYTHYTPYYSVNRSERWAHVARRQPRR